MIHIFRAKDQPATRHVVDFGDPDLRFVVRFRRRTRLWCNRCKKRRWAAYLVAHVYYDGTWFYCKDGRGCWKESA